MKVIGLRLCEGWKHVTTTRHTRALQEEVVRLRSENRALLNSILGVAGIPPIVVHGDSEFPRASEFAEDGLRAEQSGKKWNGFAQQVSAPLRHRSWQQIYRTLEFESAKRKRAGAAEEAEKVSPAPMFRR